MRLTNMDPQRTTNSGGSKSDNADGTNNTSSNDSKDRDSRSGFVEGGVKPGETAGFVEELGPFKWLYKPHTLIGLCVIVGCILYTLWESNSVAATRTAEDRIRTGAFLGAVTFIGYGAIQFRDSMMVRPHPVVWRCIHAVGILYLLLLAFVLPLEISDARILLKGVYPELGVPLEDKNYGEDCRLYHQGHEKGDWHVLWDTILDPFMLAHLLGHFGHALILRNWLLSTVISVGFEVLECSLQHILPNFQECWWDHMLLDILGMNLLGNALGIMTIRLLSNKKYNWIHPDPQIEAAANSDQSHNDTSTGGLKKISSSENMLKAVARQFVPRKVRR